MGKTITERFEIEGASREMIYSLLTDPDEMFRITEYETHIGTEAGDDFTALNGAVQGRILYVVPNRMLVTTWRPLRRKKHLIDSLLTLVLLETGKGCCLEASHINLPETEAPLLNKATYWDSVLNAAREKAAGDGRER